MNTKYSLTPTRNGTWLTKNGEKEYFFVMREIIETLESIQALRKYDSESYKLYMKQIHCADGDT